MFSEQYKWLEIKECKLGCNDCLIVQHLGVTADKHVQGSKEWRAYLVTPSVYKLNNENIDTIKEVFNSLYSLIKHNRPLSDSEGAIELKEKNGVDVGNCLSTRYSAKRTAERIYTFEEKHLVIYLQCTVESFSVLVMMFVALKELVSATMECISNTLLSTLNDCGFANEYLKVNLIAFCSNGACTIVGSKSGVATTLLENFPEVIIWH
ncbi:hypothetical protein HPG69_015133 [Diceros bicornis minor]|uniref:Uncharacterized protein n=1 Tax=Diceros bicornis minor TaxID=77932 RepID=A0A7J7FKL3_DICBM|nr:hypothetical protein HPG69_015133 [Diceros bicornis minor]